MCTVTYLPLDADNFILTSSRDVPFSREEALLPKKYIENGIELFYPKDGKAGGTWIGSSSMNRLICLLNGGFKNHISKDFYRISRGEIVKSLLKADNIVKNLNKINLTNIEPFTLVIVDWNDRLKLREFVWDGFKQHLKLLPQKEHIWSSSTLYTDEMKEMRKDWFKAWQLKLKIQSSKVKNINEKILDFHHNAGVGNPEIDVIMKRPKVGTVSITQFSKIDRELKMDYEKV